MRPSSGGDATIIADARPYAPVARLRLGAVLLLGAAVVAIYWPSTRALLELWTDPERVTYLDGLLLAGLMLWLLFDRREALAAAPVRPEGRALFLVLTLSLAWLVMRRAGIQTAAELLLPLILWSTTLVALGRPVARLSAFPIGLLLFAIPVWDVLNGALMNLTAAVSGTLVRLAGVPAHIDGNLVQVPAATFEIAGGCSGLDFLIVGLATAALYGELHRQSMSRRWLLVGAGGILSVVANWVRVAIIVLAGQLTAMQSYLVRVSHYGFGWLLYAVVLVIFLLLAQRLRGPPIPQSAPERASSRQEPRRAPQVMTMSACALLLAAVGPAWAAFEGGMPPAVTSLQPLQPGGRGWSGPLPPATPWRPSFPGADRTALAAYRRDGLAVEVYVAMYSRQMHGRKFSGYGTSVVGEGDRELSVTPISVAGQPAAQRLVIESQGGSALLWQWYQVGARTFASASRAQLWYGVASLLRNPPSRVVALRAACIPDCEAARASLESFTRDNPWLHAD